MSAEGCSLEGALRQSMLWYGLIHFIDASFGFRVDLERTASILTLKGYHEETTRAFS